MSFAHTLVLQLANVMIANSCTNVQGIVVIILCKYVCGYWIWYNYYRFMYQCTHNYSNYLLPICWPWVLHWCYYRQHSYMHNSWMGQPMGHFVELLLDWTFLPPFRSNGCLLPPPQIIWVGILFLCPHLMWFI